MAEINPINKVSADAQKLRMQNKEAIERAKLDIQEQEPSDIPIGDLIDLGEFNRLAMGKEFKELDKHLKKGSLASSTVYQEEEEGDDPILIQKVAEQFHERNPELNPRALLALRAFIKKDDSPEDLLSKVQSTYPDASLADDALDFLITSHSSDPTFQEKVARIKQQFNEVYGRDIRAGKNIQQATREFSQQGLGNPTALRNLYRDLVGNPREALPLFEELANAFPFQKMKAVIDFVLHSIGQDMKADGSSIPRPKLQRLFSEARTMQAILGVYRFFHSRTKLIANEFKRCDLTLPNMVNFQNLAKVFMNILKERYPSPQRILAFSNLLGISEEVLAKIIIFTQCRDALRNVSPKLFKSEQHRQDVLTTFIQTLSDLEDELDNDDDDEEEDDAKKRKKR
ncbi:MAG: YopN family type III secretion system gatekeeper subunit [Chlamydiae bacterium]|nr:YopN family type III secretion system gatekeeper subunit [Chlamydiota bacterium]